jgi:hypothetical protein|tara:strand:+ start:667 stop:909 length:243 start_codon:yes stop_codon:yes gene_type:complete
MATALLRNLPTGMVVVKDIFDLNGDILIPSEAEIENRHVKVLKSWGIAGVEIIGERMDSIIFDQYLKQIDSEDLKKFQDH